MNYMLLIYEDEAVTDGAREGEAFDHCVRDCDGLIDRLIESGRHIDAGILQPTVSATTIRIRGGQRLVTDGPFAETREQLAGYMVVRADNLDEAMEIAAQHPLAELGAVEIRPMTGIAFPAGTRTSEDEALLRNLIEELSQSIRAKDAERAFAVYGPGALSYAFPPPLASEPEKEGLQSWFDTWEGPIGYELHRLALNIGGDVAFSTAFLHLTGTKTDGERSELWGRVTMGFRKLEGSWKIVHEHESVPFLMDGSGKAALDLKP